MKALSTKSIGVIMIAITALSAGSMFLVTELSHAPVSPLATGSFMKGNVEVVVRDGSGQIIAYRQSDNHIVATGLNLLAKQVFYPYGTGNLSNTTGGGMVRYMEIGNGSGLASLAWDDTTLDRPLSSFSAGCTREEAVFTHTNASDAGGLGLNAQVNITAVATFDGSAGCVAENIKEAGIWQNLTSGPGQGGPSPGPGGQGTNLHPNNIMFARNTFGNVTLQATDSLQLTWKFTFTDS